MRTARGVVGGDCVGRIERRKVGIIPVLMEARSSGLEERREIHGSKERSVNMQTKSLVPRARKGDLAKGN